MCNNRPNTRQSFLQSLGSAVVLIATIPVLVVESILSN